MSAAMRDGKMAVSLSGVAETALLPLWGRVQAGQMNEPIAAAVDDGRVMDMLDYDFSRFDNRVLGLSERFLALALAARAREVDWQVRQFLLVHAHGTVVNVGAGLDDLFARADNGLATWYDIDSSEIVDLRLRLLPSTKEERVHELAGSVFDGSVLDRITAPDEGLLFVFSGVLMYFRPDDVRALFELLSHRFGNHPGGAQMAFDALAPAGAHLVQAMLARSGITDASIRWAPGSARGIERLSSHVRVMESYPLFEKTSICPAWGRSPGMLARASNHLGIYRMNRLLIAASTDSCQM